MAEGKFSEQLLQHKNIAHLTSIDAWAGDRGHNDKEFNDAVLRLEPYRGRSTVMRARFEHAIAFFKDDSLDLVYVDGYAHEGETGAIPAWWSKVKPGGILAGHDYSEQWPLVLEEVARLAARHALTITVIPAEEGRYTFPSWAVRKC